MNQQNAPLVLFADNERRRWNAFARTGKELQQRKKESRCITKGTWSPEGMRICVWVSGEHFGVVVAVPESVAASEALLPTAFVSQVQPCLRFIPYHCLAVHRERSQIDGRLLGDHSLLPNLCRGHVGMPEDWKPANWVGFGIDTRRTLWIIKVKIDWNLVTRSRDGSEARLWIVTQQSSFPSFGLLLLQALRKSLKKIRHGCSTPHAPQQCLVMPVPIQRLQDGACDAPLWLQS